MDASGQTRTLTGNFVQDLYNGDYRRYLLDQPNAFVPPPADGPAFVQDNSTPEQQLQNSLQPLDNSGTGLLPSSCNKPGTIFIGVAFACPEVRRASAAPGIANQEWAVPWVR